jgi:hypothetical protein
MEGLTTQWPKEKGANSDLQNSTQKTKDQATRTPTKTGVNKWNIFVVICDTYIP